MRLLSSSNSLAHTPTNTPTHAQVFFRAHKSSDPLVVSSPPTKYIYSKLLCGDYPITTNVDSISGVNCGDQVGVALYYNFETSDNVLAAGTKLTVSIWVDAPGLFADDFVFESKQLSYPAENYVIFTRKFCSVVVSCLARRSTFRKSVVIAVPRPVPASWGTYPQFYFKTSIGDDNRDSALFASSLFDLDKSLTCTDKPVATAPAVAPTRARAFCFSRLPSSTFVSSTKTFCSDAIADRHHCARRRIDGLDDDDPRRFSHMQRCRRIRSAGQTVGGTELRFGAELPYVRVVVERMAVFVLINARTQNRRKLSIASAVRSFASASRSKTAILAKIGAPSVARSAAAARCVRHQPPRSRHSSSSLLSLSSSSRSFEMLKGELNLIAQHKQEKFSNVFERRNSQTHQWHGKKV